MEKIGVFCSSKENLPLRYREAAQQLGTWIGKNNKILVYGGNSCGLMEEIARSTKSANGRIYGVIPQKISLLGTDSTYIDVSFHAQGLSDRKDIMLREADIFVALPGGIGTLDEVFTIISAGAFGQHNKKTILFNIDGFWDDVIMLIKNLQKKKVVDDNINRYLLVANSLEQLTDLLA